MATRTTSNSRSGASKPRAKNSTSKTQATKRLPRGKQAPVEPEGPLTKLWLALAHMVGGAFRVFGREELTKDERRDGVPFLFFLLAIVGAVVEWFNPTDSVAIALDAYTFGGLVGRVAFALPVILLLLAVWMFRHPSSVHDNGRIGIGLSILIVTVAALCHVYSGQPHPSEGAEIIARAGGVFGWLLANPLLWLGGEWLAVPLIVFLLVLSLFIITKTPPNRLGSRLRELYAYLFGAQLQTDEERAAAKLQATTNKNDSVQFGSLTDIGLDDNDTGSLPWWRRNKSHPTEDKAFDSPVIGRDNPPRSLISPRRLRPHRLPLRKISLRKRRILASSCSKIFSRLKTRSRSTRPVKWMLPPPVFATTALASSPVSPPRRARRVTPANSMVRTRPPRSSRT